MLESLSLSLSSSDRSLTHQKKKIPTSQIPQMIPHTQTEARRTHPTLISTTQTIQEPERRSTTMSARPPLPRGFEPIPVTTTMASTGIPTTHSIQVSGTSTIGGMTTTVPTTTRTIPITQEESRSRALEVV